MKITVCSPELGISPESNSGGEVYDREVINNLCSQDTKVLTYLPKNRNYFPNKNLKVDFAPIQPMYPPYIFNLFVYRYLTQIHKTRKFDLLRVHSPYFVGPAACLFKKNHPEMPIIASYLHLEKNNKIFMYLDKLLINNYDQIITISEFTKKELIKTFSFAENKIKVAYPGLNKMYKPGPKNQKLLKKNQIKNEKILLFLGGLKPRKNPLFLLDVFKKLNRKDIVLIFAGEGSLKGSLQIKAKSLGIDGTVRFGGFIPEKDKTEHYNLADIVLLPSLKEGFGMIAAEAQACAKPVIVSDNSSLPEVINNNKTGFLAKTNDVGDWGKKITLLLDNEKMRNTFGKSAGDFVTQKFSWETNAKIHKQIFEQVLKK